jgi:hypothetical protein
MKVQAGCCDPLAFGAAGLPVPVESALLPVKFEPKPLWSTPKPPSKLEVAVFAKLKLLMEAPCEFENT